MEHTPAFVRSSIFQNFLNKVDAYFSNGPEYREFRRKFILETPVEIIMQIRNLLEREYPLRVRIWEVEHILDEVAGIRDLTQTHGDETRTLIACDIVECLDSNVSVRGNYFVFNSR